MNDISLIPDLVVSSAAAIGLLIVRTQIPVRTAGLAWRFRLILLVTAFFYLTRAADWVFAIGLFRYLTILTAAIIPFSALLLAEGLLRRHAPKPVKLGAVAGLALFSVLALIVPFTRSAWFLAPFLAYQITLFIIAFGWVILRDRHQMTPPENHFADRVAICGPVILLLLMTDYRLLGLADVPTLSGMAALIIAWIASTSEARAATSWFVALTLGAVALTAGVAAMAMALHFGWTIGQTFTSAVMVFALMLAFLVWLSSSALRRSRRQALLAEALANTGDFNKYMATMRANGLMDGFTTVTSADLDGYDIPLIIHGLGADGAMSRAALPATPDGDTKAQSQIRTLLDRYTARDVYVMRMAPIELAVGTPAGLSGETAADIRAAFVIARLLDARDDRAG